MGEGRSGALAEGRRLGMQETGRGRVVLSGLLGGPASRPAFDHSGHLHGSILVRIGRGARMWLVWTFWGRGVNKFPSIRIVTGRSRLVCSVGSEQARAWMNPCVRLAYLLASDSPFRTARKDGAPEKPSRSLRLWPPPIEMRVSSSPLSIQ